MILFAFLLICGLVGSFRIGAVLVDIIYGLPVIMEHGWRCYYELWLMEQGNHIGCKHEKSVKISKAVIEEEKFDL